MADLETIDITTAWDADHIDETREAILHAVKAMAWAGIENADQGADGQRARKRIREHAFLLHRLLA